MKPGPELDALVAEKVMGLSKEPPWPKPFKWYSRWWYYDREFRPSTDIAAAWEVVEKMSEQGITVVVWAWPGGRFGCDIAVINKADLINGDSAPHAICLAALKAVGNPP